MASATTDRRATWCKSTESYNFDVRFRSVITGAEVVARQPVTVSIFLEFEEVKEAAIAAARAEGFDGDLDWRPVAIVA